MNWPFVRRARYVDVLVELEAWKKTVESLIDAWRDTSENVRILNDITRIDLRKEEKIEKR